MKLFGRRRKVQLRLLGDSVTSTLDAQTAFDYASGPLADAQAPAALIALLAELDQQHVARLPGRDELCALTQQHSADFASLFFAYRLQAHSAQDPLVCRYHECLAQRAPLTAERLSGILFVLVPGWLHRTEPYTGADMARQRQLLERLGAQVYVIALPENASVEANAAWLRRELETLALQHSQLIIASVSKAGIEVAAALDALAGTAALASIRAWINFGGTLQGTPLADLGLRWWIRWLTWIYIVPDRSLDALRSLAVEPSRRRFAELRLPASVRVVNVLGIPLSGTLSAMGRFGYHCLKSQGPNDGVTLLADALVPGASTIATLGADHFFALDDIDARVQAIVHSLLDHLDYPQLQAGGHGAAEPASPEH